MAHVSRLRGRLCRPCATHLYSCDSLSPHEVAPGHPLQVVEGCVGAALPRGRIYSDGDVDYLAPAVAEPVSTSGPLHRT